MTSSGVLPPLGGIPTSSSFGDFSSPVEPVGPVGPAVNQTGVFGGRNYFRLGTKKTSFSFVSDPPGHACETRPPAHAQPFPNAHPQE